MIYLDAAATTPVRRDVLEAAWPYLTSSYGNASSHHSVGEVAARALTDARKRVAAWLGCRANDVIFTSGGTEADNLAVKGIALATPCGRHIVTTRIEHEAVLESIEYLRRFHGFDVSFAEVDRHGIVSLESFTALLRPDTTLATVMYANNEIGTVQPISELTAASHAVGVPFHTDAVQAAGWLDCSVATLGVDALSIAGHKLGAPKGIGALFVRGRIPLEPVLHGGGQERGKRSGTENLAGAVALARAVQLAEQDRRHNANQAADARDAFIAAVTARVPGAELTGHPQRRLPTSASFVFPGASGESVLLELERRGIVSSSGSACAAGSDDPSHVLIALGYPEDVAKSAVRFSWGADIDRQALVEVADAVRAAVEQVHGITQSRSVAI
ncbi:cysteine desulfurase family protein [Rathayibacter soli]|uniref:cysteine desulfurase family protein n=1 Tax=Rathayibacter soli TaxID=3144168 RepID=UPI0027E45F4D|nr:cysteine desulfurase family protein [Glaciibacter superstes]